MQNSKLCVNFTGALQDPSIISRYHHLGWELIISIQILQLIWAYYTQGSLN
jgi:hypothetical protein